MKKYIEDENGYVKFSDIPLSKAGVFPYLGSQLPASLNLNPDQIYQVYRPAEELNNPDTIESFKGMPWFNRHEMAGDEFGKGAEEVGAHGSIGDNVRFESGTLLGNLTLFSSSLKRAIKSGLEELSCGFKCAYELAKGVAPTGERYDVIQRRIRGNHLASVPQGRMGGEVSVAMDQLTFAIDNLKIEKEEGSNMSDLEELIAKVKEAQPAKAELEKIYAQLGEMIHGESGEKVDVDVEGDVVDQDKIDATPDAGEDEGDKVMVKEKVESAMDEAAINKLVEAKVKAALEGVAMDAAAIEKRINEKNALVSQVTPIIGMFDASAMDTAAVAKYAVGKIGIACDSGAEVATLNGYLAARKQPTFTVDDGVAQDAAVKSAKVLEDMGL